MIKKHLTKAIAAFCSVFLLTACTSKSSDKSNLPVNNDTQSNTTSNSNKTQYPLKITVYDDNGTSYEQVFDKAPTRAIPNNQGMVETMLELGLDEAIVGIGSTDGTVPEHLAGRYGKLPVLSKTGISKEIAVGATPDIVLGRSTLFTDDFDWGCGSIKELNNMGIKAYSQLSSIPNAKLDALLEDIKNIGLIFDIQDKATAYIKKLKNMMNRIDKKMEGITEQRKYIFMYGPTDSNQFGVFGRQHTTMHDDALSHLKLSACLEETPESLSAEQLIALNPDVILYMDTTSNTNTAEEAVKGLLNNNAIGTVSAIQGKQIYVVNFSEFMQFNSRIYGALEKLSEEMHPNLK